MLIRRSGAWLVARGGGEFLPIPSEKAAHIDALLSEGAFWAEPSFNPPTCTDAGGSLLWLRVEGRPATVRQGSCGSMARTEQLVLLALES
jgi:hypothetical protein